MNARCDLQRRGMLAASAVAAVRGRLGAEPARRSRLPVRRQLSPDAARHRDRSAGAAGGRGSSRCARAAANGEFSLHAARARARISPMRQSSTPSTISRRSTGSTAASGSTPRLSRRVRAAGRREQRAARRRSADDADLGDGDIGDSGPRAGRKPAHARFASGPTSNTSCRRGAGSSSAATSPT